jgi:hypothetical protein
VLKEWIAITNKAKIFLVRTQLLLIFLLINFVFLEPKESHDRKIKIQSRLKIKLKQLENKE